MKRSKTPKIKYPQNHTCKICGKALNTLNYTTHFRKHSLTKDEYFKQYLPVLYKETIKVGKYTINKNDFRGEWNVIRSKIREPLNNPTYSQLKFILYSFAIDGTIRGNAKYYDAVFKYWFKEYTLKECVERWILLKNFEGSKTENLDYFVLRYGETEGKRRLKEKSMRIMGDKNPGYQHNGRFSALSDNFLYADKTDKKEVIKKISESNKIGANTTIHYWINKGYSEEEARKKLTERQKTFSKEICIKKYGEEEGIKRWKKRQEKWLNNFPKITFSQISQKLFWGISKKLDSLENIYFAELGENKKPDKSGYNNEYRLSLKESYVMPDFIDLEKRKIIEFDGTYWHGEHIVRNPSKAREETRDSRIKEMGYEVLHIKEEDYRNNPDKEIEKCIKYLKE